MSKEIESILIGMAIGIVLGVMAAELVNLLLKTPSSASSAVLG